MGTTYGTSDRVNGGVYRLRKAGNAYNVIHTFDGTQGAHPQTGVLVGTDGRLLYGTTPVGGPFKCRNYTGGSGVLYQTGPSGGFRILHNFGHQTGVIPDGDLIFGPDGSLYGTVPDRCSSQGVGNGNGLVFRMSTDHAYSVLHTFDDTAVAASPSAG